MRRSVVIFPALLTLIVVCGFLAARECAAQEFLDTAGRWSSLRDTVTSPGSPTRLVFSELEPALRTRMRIGSD